ncbi:MAG: hypothetical protein FWF51_11360 [Chitinivibrionia bacterium]|nr:hypothetical protein [Chitinivibrionia bacterium]
MISKIFIINNGIKFVEIILPVIMFSAIIVSAQETIIEIEPATHYVETPKEKLLRMQNSISKLLLKDTITIKERNEDAAKNEAFEIAKSNAAQYCKAMIKSIQKIENDDYSEQSEKTVFQMTSIKQYKILKETRRKFTFEIITETDTSAVIQKLMELYDEQKIQNKILIDSIEIKERERIRQNDSIANHYGEYIDSMEITHFEQIDSIAFAKDTVINGLETAKNEIQSEYREYKSNAEKFVENLSNETKLKDILIIVLVMAGLIMFMVIVEYKNR